MEVVPNSSWHFVKLSLMSRFFALKATMRMIWQNGFKAGSNRFPSENAKFHRRDISGLEDIKIKLKQTNLPRSNVNLTFHFDLIKGKIF